MKGIRMVSLAVIALALLMRAVVGCRSAQPQERSTVSFSPLPPSQSEPTYTTSSRQSVSPLPTPTRRATLIPTTVPEALFSPLQPPASLRYTTPTPCPPLASVSTTPPYWTPYAGEPFSIVFYRPFDLWLKEIAGEERQLTHEGPDMTASQFAISPDGNAIVYRAEDVPWDSVPHDEMVKIVDLRDGSVLTLATVKLPDNVFDVAWWDANHPAYYTWQPSRTRTGDEPGKLRSLVVIDLLTGESTEQPVSTLQHPSPDGRYLLSGDRSIFLRRGLDCVPYRLQDLETGEEWQVTEQSDVATFLGWSADSRYMLFSRFYPQGERQALLIAETQTKKRWLLTPEDKVVRAAAWSPDGRHIAYVQCDPPIDACSNTELWLVDPEGEAKKAVSLDTVTRLLQSGGPGVGTYALVFGLGWSPGGSRLVFQRFETLLTPETIWSIRIDGTDLRPLAEGQNPQVVVPR